MRLFKLRFPFSKKNSYAVSGENNIVPPPNTLFRAHKKNRLNVCGNGNTVTIGTNVTGRLSISIYGDNCSVKISSEVIGGGTSIMIGAPGAPARNVSITIGKGTTFSGPCTLRAMDDESKITIGADVMFSEGIHVWASDTHSILDAAGTLQNRGGEVIIGDHTWIGMDAKIGKNVKIGEGSIIGWNSVVCAAGKALGGSYPPRVLLAGNPAQIRKTDVIWSRRSPNLYLNSANRKEHACDN